MLRMAGSVKLRRSYGICHARQPWVVRDRTKVMLPRVSPAHDRFEPDFRFQLRRSQTYNYRMGRVFKFLILVLAELSQPLVERDILMRSWPPMIFASGQTG